jgi:hypothetical protein
MKAGIHGCKSGAWIWYLEREEPWSVGRCIYRTLNGEVAQGFTNHTKNEKGEDVYFILLERDDKEIALEDWLRGLTMIGVKPVIAAETARGYHVVTANAFKSKQDLTAALELVSQTGLVDDGMYALARIREGSDIPFTNILRIAGKYNYKDITVRRWLPPPTPWHANVLGLYAQKATLEISATRLAHRCPGYTGRPGPAAKAGLEIHRTWEKEMEEKGWRTEVQLWWNINNLRFQAVADALMEHDDYVDVIELKSTERAAQSIAAERQLIAETALAALQYQRPAFGWVQTPDGETHAGAMVAPDEAKHVLLALLRTTFTKPTCETCIFNSYCKGWVRK